MNYLAHMVVGHWAGLDEKGVLGNFMGDAVKGRDVEGMWGVDVGRGIRLHRAIDDVSDRHEASREARKLLRETCGKWSGVVWDVLVDHVLAQDFECLATGCGALTAFAGSHEAILAAQRETMPERSRRFFDAMVSHGWLVGYGARCCVSGGRRSTWLAPAIYMCSTSKTSRANGWSGPAGLTSSRALCHSPSSHGAVKPLPVRP